MEPNLACKDLQAQLQTENQLISCQEHIVQGGTDLEPCGSCLEPDGTDLEPCGTDLKPCGADLEPHYQEHSASQSDNQSIPDITALITEQNIQCCTCHSVITTSDSICVNSKYFHRECLKCGICSRTFHPDDQLYTGANNVVLCELCKVSNPGAVSGAECCGYCKKVIEPGEEATTALERRWHATCFVCTGCGDALTGFFRDAHNVPYCESCWLQNYAQTCSACNDKISEQVMVIEEKPYHVGCVKCAVCGRTFDNVLDILTIDTDFWHVDCFREDESESDTPDSPVSTTTSSALLGIYNKSLGFTSAPIPPSRKISTVSFVTPQPLQTTIIVADTIPADTTPADTQPEHNTRSEVRTTTTTRTTCCTVT